ncbi:chlorohydrolase domain protein (plasmid) [Sinorhizobium sp. RAC02]|nr:chlorohydrolase domain protein [Sinorhizobium sp. RAC02]
MRRARGADGHHRARSDAEHALHMCIAIDRIVGAHDGITAAEQRDTCGDAETQALQRGKLRLRKPELRRRADRIGTAAGLVPRIALAAAECLDQPVAGMGVGIDEAGHDRHAARIDDLAGRMRGLHLRRRPDGHDAVAGDGDRPIGDDPALRIDGNDGAVLDEDIGHGGSPVCQIIPPRPAATGCGRARVRGAAVPWCSRASAR